MIGTITNTCAILAGATIGSIIKKGIKDDYKDAIFTALGLATIAMGLNACVQNMPNSLYPVLFIASMALGALIGTALKLEKHFRAAVSKHSKSGDSNEFAQGLSTCIMLFCVGTLSILGPINSALYGDETYLFTNAMLDFVTSMLFGASFGIGIAIAAPILFCWQGAIYLLASVLAPLLSGGLMAEIAIVGGLLIMASGINLLNIKQISSMDLLPALFIPPIWFALITLTGNFWGLL